MLLQDDIFKSLIAKAAAVDCASENLRSEHAKTAIIDLLSVTQSLRDSREIVTKSFNVAADAVRKDEANRLKKKNRRTKASKRLCPWLWT